MDHDPGEQVNLYDAHPAVVRELEKLLEACREDLGDQARVKIGKNVRKIGKVTHSKPLTSYHCNHPYMIAMYDLEDFG